MPRAAAAAFRCRYASYLPPLDAYAAMMRHICRHASATADLLPAMPIMLPPPYDAAIENMTP